MLTRILLHCCTLNNSQTAKIVQACIHDSYILFQSTLVLILCSKLCTYDTLLITHIKCRVTEIAQAFTLSIIGNCHSPTLYTLYDTLSIICEHQINASIPAMLFQSLLAIIPLLNTVYACCTVNNLVSSASAKCQVTENT